MIRRTLLAAWCVMLATTSIVLAQAGRTNAAADPISGTWTGEFKVQDKSAKITMELKFDGKSLVSGTFTGLQQPGDVKSGTFDPKTGSLKLQLGIQGEPAVLIVLDGAVAKDTATGHVTGEETGEFKLTKKAASK
jgi:hypothetical protein